jgi:hypothetical protein
VRSVINSLPNAMKHGAPRYRRDKPLNNDMDIVFSYPNQEQGADIIKGLCQKLSFHKVSSEIVFPQKNPANVMAVGLITHIMRSFLSLGTKKLNMMKNGGQI